MAILMSDADIAIGSGGTTSWERCCMGLPTLTVTDADNQVMILDSLSQVGAIKHLGWFTDLKSESIARELRRLNKTSSELISMSHAARAICDGQGVQRIMAKICNLFPAERIEN